MSKILKATTAENLEFKKEFARTVSEGISSKTKNFKLSSNVYKNKKKSDIFKGLFILGLPLVFCFFHGLGTNPLELIIQRILSLVILITARLLFNKVEHNLSKKKNRLKNFIVHAFIFTYYFDQVVHKFEKGLRSTIKFIFEILGLKLPLSFAAHTCSHSCNHHSPTDVLLYYFKTGHHGPDPKDYLIVYPLFFTFFIAYIIFGAYINHKKYIFTKKLTEKEEDANSTTCSHCSINTRTLESQALNYQTFWAQISLFVVGLLNLSLPIFKKIFFPDLACPDFKAITFIDQLYVFSFVSSITLIFAGYLAIIRRYFKIYPRQLAKENRQTISNLETLVYFKSILFCLLATLANEDIKTFLAVEFMAFELFEVINAGLGFYYYCKPKLVPLTFLSPHGPKGSTKKSISVIQKELYIPNTCWYSFKRYNWSIKIMALKAILRIFSNCAQAIFILVKGVLSLTVSQVLGILFCFFAHGLEHLHLSLIDLDLPQFCICQAGCTIFMKLVLTGMFKNYF